MDGKNKLIHEEKGKSNKKQMKRSNRNRGIYHLNEWRVEERKKIEINKRKRGNFNIKKRINKKNIILLDKEGDYGKQ